MKKQSILTFITLLLVSINYAQTGTITGVTVDASGSLPGVNIVVKDTGKGAISNLDGNFAITNVPTGKQILVLSFIGYSTFEKEITVNEGENDLGIISLSESDGELEESSC